MKKYLIIAFLMAQGFAVEDSNDGSEIGDHVFEGFLDVLGDDDGG
ncbi:MAG: hypothetical protein P8L77_04815 [Gammaproteobacteria bacterium]|nr:hypothetical protein [Gammaproteobacteria bacterium]